MSISPVWKPCTKALPAGRAVADARCGPALPVPPAGACDELIVSREKALRALTVCPDTAIEALERFALQDPVAGSDLAAAYSVRAQRRDRPTDLLRALAPAERAIAAAPRNAAAQFNHALILQELGLDGEAVIAWDALLKIDDSPWAAEGRAHRDRLARPRAAAGNDLVTRHPLTAMKQFEERPSRALAEALSKRLRDDPFPLDVMRSLERASPADLRDAQAAFVEARSRTRAFEDETRLYLDAARGFERAGSPLHLVAKFGYAIALLRTDRHAALAVLDEIEPAARAGNYRHLVGRIRELRAFALFRLSRYLEALTETDAALAVYEASGDDESRARLHSRRIGYYRTVGQYEVSWREALKARWHASSLGDVQSIHFLLGEMAATAAMLDYPNLALRYQSAALSGIQAAYAAADRTRPDIVANLRRNLAIALRERAGIEINLGHLARAEADLAEAARLAPDEKADANGRRAFEARHHELVGISLLPKDAPRAAAEFSEALARVSADELHTLRASLLAHRADARTRAGLHEEAERDRREALEELRSEETRMLESRGFGSGEEIWQSYFSRFDETYENLVRQLVDQQRPDQAFAYAERARAFELLDLILRHGHAPESFRRLARNGQPIALPDIRSALPPGTFLIQYDVQAGRTYTWIVSREAFAVLTQRATAADVERWSEALQLAAERPTDRLLNAALSAPYDELIAAPLAAIAKMPGGRSPARLVFVPDEAMHGLPINGLRDPVTRRHLIELGPTIENAASATLYLYSVFRDAALPSSEPPSILLIGDPAFDPLFPLAQRLPRLPGAGREVEGVRKLYGRDARVRVDAEATAAEFFDLARSHTVLHIAAHAVANGDKPWESLLLFAPDAPHSGAIDAKELLSELKLHETRLAVLSACSSAGGLPVGPEGVAPLVRPFIAAGVPAVIGSLWNVRDATAEHLLVSFHRHYRKGSDAAAAMQAAQRELLTNKNAALRSALAWAPFQVIGHASSPFAARQQHSRRNTLEFRTANLLQRHDVAHSERRRDGTDRTAPQR